jgi:DNA-binding FadR family transcriptional regulator
MTMGFDSATSLSESRVTRAEALARTLESEIVTAGMTPGERLGTKDDLRQRFGVAVATLNEAVRLMEMRGLVTARPGPGGGVFVSPPSKRANVSQLVLGFSWGKATLGDCVEVRSALEPLICRHAARDHQPSDIRALGKIVDKLEANTGDPHTFFEVNWEFHRRLAMVCTNAPLQTMYLVICDFLHSGLSDLEHGPVEPERAEVHRRLLVAIDEGDDEQLEVALAEHTALSPITRPEASPER